MEPIKSQEMATAYREGYILGRISVLRKIKKLSREDLVVRDEEIVKEFERYMKDYQNLKVLHPKDIDRGAGDGK